MPATPPPQAHAIGQASPWVQRWSHLVPAGGTVLDVACGSGRHMAWFAQRGHAVTGLDRSPEAVAQSAHWGHVLQADIESAPWPLLQGDAPKTFDAVVVTHYLWRALFPNLLQSLALGGVLIYETFAQGNETLGKPSRPDFLLQPAELLQRCASLHIVAYENGFLTEPERFVQRIVAVREGELSAAPARYTLATPTTTPKSGLHA